MNNQSNYNIPGTKKEKLELLKALLKGEKTLEDIQDEGIRVTLWRQDGPDHWVSFAGSAIGSRITKEQHEQMMKSSKGMVVTLDLS